MWTRRKLLRQSVWAGALAGLTKLVPGRAGAKGYSGPAKARGQGVFNLEITETPVTIGGKKTLTTTVNGSLPGPALRFREGDEVTIRVANRLNRPTSIHWHGILLPAGMDGVPGVSFPGIAPGETFTYRYRLKQSGTYWYHSHSGFQEQTGLSGPIIVDPAGPDPVAYDREHVVMLTDWTFENPHAVFRKLKVMSDYYNRQKRTVADFFRDAHKQGLGATLRDRLAWGAMRMDPTDISDVTGATYTYLMNGHAPGDNWTALYRPGERVRLRLINGASMTYFNVRLAGAKSGLAMTVVAADGQNVKPVTVDEIQIAVAETYDVIVTPTGGPFTIFAEAMDRSGFARGTLASEPGQSAPVPPLGKPPLRSMADMGMADMGMGDMKGMDMGGMSHQPAQPHVDKPDPKPMSGDMSGDMAGMDMSGGDMSGMDMSGMKGPASTKPAPPAKPASPAKPVHLGGPGVDNVAAHPVNRLGEPGLGLEHTGRRVLVYDDLESLAPDPDARPATRHITLHLTGNMERYMWSFDGKTYSQKPDPIPFIYGERLRITYVNDTMMDHPMHLHGMWQIVDNGHGAANPRKHTISVRAGSTFSVEVEADAPGHWAYHCHLLYHMMAGMFRVVAVGSAAGDHHG